jgi:chemotaxis protein MotB
VQGLAASVLYEKDNPESPLNRRISIIVMNRAAEDRMFESAQAEGEIPPNTEEDEGPIKGLSRPSVGR